jgi:hypothetical protein
MTETPHAQESILRFRELASTAVPYERVFEGGAPTSLRLPTGGGYPRESGPEGDREGGASQFPALSFPTACRRAERGGR